MNSSISINSEQLLDMSLLDLEKLTECASTCTFGRRCIENLSLKALFKLKKDFWGARHDPPPLPEERKKKISKVFNEYMVQRADEV
jgi:hypothetical protein